MRAEAKLSIIAGSLIIGLWFIADSLYLIVS